MWVLLFLAGCATARRGEPIAGPLALDAREERGAEVFARNCYRCHPGGEGGVGFSLNDKPLPGFAIRLQTRIGFGVMPSFGRDRISPKEMDDLVAYLLSLRRHRS